MAYIEAKGQMKKGNRLWMIGFGARGIRVQHHRVGLYTTIFPFERPMG
jgi:hypothetical protein